jgi:hypothetical protein
LLSGTKAGKAIFSSEGQFIRLRDFSTDYEIEELVDKHDAFRNLHYLRKEERPKLNPLFLMWSIQTNTVHHVISLTIKGPVILLILKRFIL